MRPGTGATNRLNYVQVDSSIAIRPASKNIKIVVKEMTTCCRSSVNNVDGGVGGDIKTIISKTTTFKVCPKQALRKFVVGNFAVRQFVVGPFTVWTLRRRAFSL